MSDTWPPKLKEWVARCLGQMTDANRAAASQEMKEVIAQAFEQQTLWTTDWVGVQLQSLLPKALPTPFASPAGNKRKNENGVPTSKKQKKSALKAASAPDLVDQAALSRRAQRFQREHEIERNKSVVTFPKRGVPSLLERTSVSTYASPYSYGTDDPEITDAKNWDQYTIVGTSKTLFKDYLRLTSEPKPEQIRPLPVLQQALAELKARWRELSQKPDTQYNWICSQFKSLRQDLVVQRISTEFTVKAYEIHARIALQVGDDVEYNSCLNRLQGLYESGLPGQRAEFTAYHILQLVRGLNHSQLNLYVSRLTPEQKAEEEVAHALSVQRAVSSGNYRAFFQLYLSAPKMSGYIMDHMKDRERVKALIIMTRSYMKLPVTFISHELAFEGMLESDDSMDPVSQGAADTIEFLARHKVVAFTNPNAGAQEKILDCRACQDIVPKVFEEQYRKVTLKARI